MGNCQKKVKKTKKLNISIFKKNLKKKHILSSIEIQKIIYKQTNKVQRTEILVSNIGCSGEYL